EGPLYYLLTHAGHIFATQSGRMPMTETSSAPNFTLFPALPQSRPAPSDLPYLSLHRAINPDDCAMSFAARYGVATFESRRGPRSPVPREPASRETPPAATSADN